MKEKIKSIHSFFAAFSLNLLLDRTVPTAINESNTRFSTRTVLFTVQYVATIVTKDVFGGAIFDFFFYSFFEKL